MSGCEPEGGTDEVTTLGQHVLGRRRPSRWSGDDDNGLDNRQETDNQRGVGGEGVSGAEDLNDGHTARERGDLQHVLMTGFGIPRT